MLSPGSSLGAYSITELLGRGGMGEVYAAKDTKLRRRVAVKVLPAAMAEHPERLARFRREAVAVAALNHPNIVTVYSVEEADGVHFLTMELIEGAPLSERIPDSGMSVADILELAGPLANALRAAHEKGITHRDLKPHNVMIADDGAVKVLDFGLAKIEASSPGSDFDSAAMTEARTQEGAIVGTFPYMSPEQASGGRVDARSDVFSFGVMLYEMASGRRPFQGDSGVALLSSILKDDPPPLDYLPRDLRSVLERCLAKDPDARFQNGEELAAALSPREQVAAPTALSVPRIVVQPFTSSGVDDELASFAAGLTEDVIGGLLLFPYLSIVAGGREHAHEERFAVEGSLRKSGTKVRASVKLVDCSTGAHLWAEQFDCDLASQDVFATQDEMTDRIVATVADPSGVLSRSLLQMALAKPQSQLTVFDCVFRMFRYSWSWRADQHAELRDEFEKVLKGEPRSSMGWACLSGLYLDEHRYFYNRRPDPLGRALAAAQRAVELDATNPLAYRALAEAQYFRRELGAFRSARDRVMSLNPRDTHNIAYVNLLTCYAGDWEQGYAFVEKALAMNPHHAGWLYFLVAWYHYHKHDYDKALEAAENINMPGHTGQYLLLTVTNAQAGNLDAARKHARDLVRHSPNYPKVARTDLRKWFVSEEFVEQALEGLAKAGLEIPAP